MCIRDRVKLNGMLHGDEKVGVREIARQLCAAGDALEFSRAAGFGENVAFMREVLRALERGGRAVVFVLEEFDLFAKGGAKSKQTLLYAVMDLLQQTQVQAAVVGVTCPHDAAERLETRFKSRVSSSPIPPAPPVGRMRAATLVRHALSLPLPPPAKGGDEERGEGAAAETGAAASPTGIEPALVYPPDPGFAARWNEAVDAAVRVVVAREDGGRVRRVAGPQDVGRLGAPRVARREDVAFRRRVPQNRGERGTLRRTQHESRRGVRGPFDAARRRRHNLSLIHI